MPTFVYAPGVKVYIDTDRNGIIDVSDDVTEGTMVRRSDGVSTFNFTLQNNRRKYDLVFTPNDRIIVMMKRVTWVRVFTGYLNSVPVKSAWPSTVNLAASCSLKRLQYWYWDPHATYTMNMIRAALAAGANGQGDGGATNVLLSILNNVVGWPAKKVHVSKIPPEWLALALDAAEELKKTADADTFAGLDIFDTSFGDGSGTTNTVGDANQVAAGNYAYPANSKGYTFNATQMRAVRTIYTTCVQNGLTNDDIAFVTYCAMAETNLKADYYNPSGASKGAGLFSQIASDAFMQRLANSAALATTEFIDRYKRKYLELPDAQKKQYSNWVARSKQVQAWGKAGNYAKPEYQSGARGVIYTIAGTTTAATGGGGSNAYNVGLALGAAPDPKVGAPKGGLVNNQTFLNKAVAMEQAYPEILYESGGSSRAYQPGDPGRLVCNEYIAWIFWLCTGKKIGGSNSIPLARNIYSAYTRHIDVATALKTPGALLFALDGSRHHVAISLGAKTTKGSTAIGSRRKRGLENKPEDQTGFQTDAWSHGGLLIGVDYSALGLGGAAITEGSGTPSTTSDAASNDPNSSFAVPMELDPSDPFNSLFGGTWEPSQDDTASTGLAQALVGIRSLLNDQQLLPYLRDLMFSTMRSISSAPNGDFIAWFPDFYGIWGTAAKLVIEPIEVMDFNVTWTDDFFVTHQYVLAGQNNYLDVASGQVSTNYATDAGADIKTQTYGIATVEMPYIMKLLFNIEADEQFATKVLTRFGARPDYQQVDGLIGKTAEYFSALYLFMRQWVYQYNADVPITFMPEAWPGMLVQIPALDFQAYIVTVTHSFKFGQGGGFQTLLNISSPARMPNGKKGSGEHAMIGLPDFGGLVAGRNSQALDQSITLWSAVPSSASTQQSPSYGRTNGSNTPLGS